MYEKYAELKIRIWAPRRNCNAVTVCAEISAQTSVKVIQYAAWCRVAVEL